MKRVRAAWDVFRQGLQVLLIFAIGMFVTDVLAAPVEWIAWKKVPIRVELAVGQEQRIDFPGRVRVGIPAAVQPVLRAQIVSGSVYLLAYAPFASSRLILREPDSGRIYLFDVSASHEAEASSAMQVFVPDQLSNSVQDAPPGEARPAREPGYVELTRFAARQLYAPARLVRDTQGFVRVAVSRKPIALVRGLPIDAIPLVAWRTRSLYITAVKLINRSDQAQDLDARTLRGTWLTATFQHHRLLPAGDEADTTTVYLISARPFRLSHAGF